MGVRGSDKSHFRPDPLKSSPERFVHSFPFCQLLREDCLEASCPGNLICTWLLHIQEIKPYWINDLHWSWDCLYLFIFQLNCSLLCQSLLYSKVSQLHTYILFLIYSFPSWFIPGCWIQFPVLYSRTLLFTHRICNSVYLLIPNSQSIPPSPLFPLGNHQSVLYVCESVSVL